ncbi:unnamed protein product [Pleuronectes platessa]|uniref:Uncharacterized protein n=1 Tax=Pleuronectes platessa TaxID=8262 RepID=A0A9N7Y5F8_PLEPL|nr:unnamed protein product [Pleuronectes platessa]
MREEDKDIFPLKEGDSRAAASVTAMLNATGCMCGPESSAIIQDRPGSVVVTCVPGISVTEQKPAGGCDGETQAPGIVVSLLLSSLPLISQPDRSAPALIRRPDAGTATESGADAWPRPFYLLRTLYLQCLVWVILPLPAIRGETGLRGKRSSLLSVEAPCAARGLKQMDVRQNRRRQETDGETSWWHEVRTRNDRG